MKKLIAEVPRIRVGTFFKFFFYRSLRLYLLHWEIASFFYAFKHFKYFFENIYLFDRFIFFTRHNYLSFNLKKRQVFFNLLDPFSVSKRFFSNGGILRFLKKREKQDKYKQSNGVAFILFLRRFFRVFLYKNLVLIFKSFRLRHKYFLKLAIELFGDECSGMYVVPRARYSRYFFRRVKAVKRKIKRKLK